jgi:hypothetical protein
MYLNIRTVCTLIKPPQTFLWFACHVAYEEHAEVFSLIIHMQMLWDTLQGPWKCSYQSVTEPRFTLSTNSRHQARISYHTTKRTTSLTPLNFTSSIATWCKWRMCVPQLFDMTLSCLHKHAFHTTVSLEKFNLFHRRWHIKYVRCTVEGNAPSCTNPASKQKGWGSNS